MILIAGLAAITLGSCKKHDSSYVSGSGMSLAVLKVDFQTHKFEGGKVFHFDATGAVPQTIPIQMTYAPPGDFGNITLQYAPTGDTIFDGSIIWSGKGKMTQPALSNNFAAGTTAQPAPDTNDVQVISPGTFIKKEAYNIPAVWSGISNLYITREFLQAHNTRIGIFLYTPSVGIGDPADWDYFWLLYTGFPGVG